MPVTVDHLLYGSPELDSGVAEIERLTGVRPRYGGKHLGLGTHNALLSLGAGTYLEVIAPDPSQGEVDPTSLPYGIGSLEAPALRAWAAAPGDIERAVRDAREAGVGFGQVTAHRRRTPEGDDVRWRMATLETAGEGVSVLPFLIDWGKTEHPSAHAPSGVLLVELRIVGPEPVEILRQLGAMRAVVAVSEADAPGLEAVLVGPAGREVVLRS